MTTPRQRALKMRQIRARVAGRMQAALEAYFSKLAGDVTQRFVAMATPGKAAGDGTDWEQLPFDDLLLPEDTAALTELVKRFYVSLLKQSWGAWNAELGMSIEFDLTDPVVTKLLGMAGTRIKDINDTTLQSVRDLMQQASELGWSIQHIVEGDKDLGIAGMRDRVEQTYKGRARACARTEMAFGAQQASVDRYRSADVTQVDVMDDGLADDDQECIDADGQVWDLDYAEANPIAHPNCVRCFSARLEAL